MCLLTQQSSLTRSCSSPGKVVVAFDDDHVALALVVGKVRRGSETCFRLALVPGDIKE